MKRKEKPSRIIHMSDNIKIFQKYISAHNITKWRNNVWVCESILCADCILCDYKVCKPHLTDDEMKFLKQEYPEHFL